MSRLSPRALRILRATFGALALTLAYWLAAAAVLDSFMDHWALGDKWRKSRFNRAIHYTAPRPFVFRVLTPWLVNQVSAALPDSARSALAARTVDLRERYELRAGNDVEYAVAYYLVFSALFGTLWVWRALLRRLGRGSPLLWSFAPPVAFLFLPMTFMQGGFLYDASELFLTSLALLLFLGRRWWLFYPVFALCVVNKDSNVLLPIWFVATFLVERSWSFLVRHGLLSVAVGAPPFLLIRWWFSDAKGEALRPHWSHNLQYLGEAKSYWSGFEPFATHIGVPEGFHLANLFLVGALVVLASRVRYLREVLLIFVCTVVAFLPFFLLFGYRDEIRVFAPSFAALVLLATHALREALAPEPAAEPSAASGEGLA